MRSLLSSLDLDRSEVETILARAALLERHEAAPLPFPGKALGLAFFTDSLRTRVGFEVAAGRCGITSVSVLRARKTAEMSWAESDRDSLASVGAWFDCICIRSASPDAPAHAGASSSRAVINCGNGADEHPTQSLIDLYAFSSMHHRIDNLRLGIVGALSDMRSAHSLVRLLSRYRGVTVRCISPPGLNMPERYTAEYTAVGNRLERCEDLDLVDLDALYVAGLPGRCSIPVEDADRDRLRVTTDLLHRYPEMQIYCPMPRLDEIDPQVDRYPQARYFDQSARAIFVRIAILEWAFSGRLTSSGN